MLCKLQPRNESRYMGLWFIVASWGDICCVWISYNVCFKHSIHTWNIAHSDIADSQRLDFIAICYS